jgi:hypothetical protein
MVDQIQTIGQEYLLFVTLQTQNINAVDLIRRHFSKMYFLLNVVLNDLNQL